MLRQFNPESVFQNSGTCACIGASTTDHLRSSGTARCTCGRNSTREQSGSEVIQRVKLSCLLLHPETQMKSPSCSLCALSQAKHGLPLLSPAIQRRIPTGTRLPFSQSCRLWRQVYQSFVRILSLWSKSTLQVPTMAKFHYLSDCQKVYSPPITVQNLKTSLRLSTREQQEQEQEPVVDSRSISTGLGTGRVLPSWILAETWCTNQRRWNCIHATQTTTHWCKKWSRSSLWLESLADASWPPPFHLLVHLGFWLFQTDRPRHMVRLREDR